MILSPVNLKREKLYAAMVAKGMATTTVEKATTVELKSLSKKIFYSKKPIWVKNVERVVDFPLLL